MTELATSFYHEYCTTTQLHDEGSSHEIILWGTLAKDELPLPPIELPKMYIINQQNSNQAGDHWIVLWVDTVCQYFDSLGNEPQPQFKHWLYLNNHPYQYNIKRLQNKDSNVCGQYCLMYCYFKSRDVSFKTFLNMFDNNLFLNDVKTQYFYDLTV